MSKSRYHETEHFKDRISPAGTFSGDDIVRIRDRESGDVKSGRGWTYEQARDKAITKAH